MQAVTLVAKAGTRCNNIGAEPQTLGGVHFRVWAPGKSGISLVICDEQKKPSFEMALESQANGYFAAVVDEAGPGTLYGFRISDQPEIFPDPASRFQPLGPDGPSQVVDTASFTWTDSQWRGVDREGQVIYEMHFGTFTPEGTYAAAAEQLSELADLGITVIELMPVADFSGPFGWGYDGVCLFAPTRLYGKPEELASFIDRAHALGIGVIHDVVYNHFGPVGQYMERFSDYYFSKEHKTDWGTAINYDGTESTEVRNYFLANVAYWIKEFHFDGLRFDATQDIHDESPDHILAAMARQARAAAPSRKLFLVAENEPQHAKIVRSPAKGGFGLDSLWNDDFHHSAMVALAGRHEAYFADYRGTPQEFISCAKHGYLYQGQWYAWQKKCRGASALDIPPAGFINFLQNHDQVANSIRGARVHDKSQPGCYRAMTALMLLSPGTPMLFQGQEFASSSPFWFFADPAVELRESYRKGRLEFLSQFPSIVSASAENCSSDPSDPATFEGCKLDFAERQSNAPIYAMHRDLLRLRREDSTIRRQQRGSVDGAVLAAQAFVMRYFGEEQDDRLLLINLGIDTKLAPAPEPYLAPPENCMWELLWSSEDPLYGGNGTPIIDTGADWTLPGYSAMVMKPTIMTKPMLDTASIKAIIQG